MKRQLKSYLSKIGQWGGKMSRRALSSKDAREMVRVREARRYYQQF
jgi:hypothetical protein